MFVVKPLIDDRELKAFSTAKAANEWAQTGAYRETLADVCEVHWVAGDPTRQDAVDAVKAGHSEKRAAIHRRMSAQEIEELERREAEAFLRDLGL